MKIIAIGFFVAIILLGGAIIIIGGKDEPKTEIAQAAGNVSIVDGKQVVSITARGGYSPRVTTAKSGLPTIIKMDTIGTYDCSSALVVPSLGYRKNLPPSGETLIDVPPQKPGTVLQGLCSMGMYNFKIRFN
ncbi:MAG: cupredoxin domain-containing protein [Patescibacteria group bacterium]|nr:cupredoxin domain-containing protein [Patescibacteria group bacterium]MBU2509228.1 cupredoxin domain-containing protein [Patescibacteria group bacterium]